MDGSTDELSGQAKQLVCDFQHVASHAECFEYAAQYGSAAPSSLPDQAAHLYAAVCTAVGDLCVDGVESFLNQFRSYYPVHLILHCQPGAFFPTQHTVGRTEGEQPRRRSTNTQLESLDSASIVTPGSEGEESELE